MNLIIHSWLNSGKVRELESQKARESQGTLLKKIGWKPWRSVRQFSRICSRKSFFAKSKIDKSRKLRGGRGRVQKNIYIQTPSVWSFSGIAHTPTCPPAGYQDQAYLARFNQIYFTVTNQKNLQIVWHCLF